MTTIPLEGRTTSKRRVKKQAVARPKPKEAKEQISLDEAIDLTLASLREGTAHAHEIDRNNPEKSIEKILHRGE